MKPQYRLKVLNKKTGKFLCGATGRPIFSNSGKNWKNINQIARLVRTFTATSDFLMFRDDCEIIAYELVEKCSVSVKDAIGVHGFPIKEFSHE